MGGRRGKEGCLRTFQSNTNPGLGISRTSWGVNYLAIHLEGSSAWVLRWYLSCLRALQQMVRLGAQMDLSTWVELNNSVHASALPNRSDLSSSYRRLGSGAITPAVLGLSLAGPYLFEPCTKVP